MSLLILNTIILQRQIDMDKNKLMKYARAGEYFQVLSINGSCNFITFEFINQFDCLSSRVATVCKLNYHLYCQNKYSSHKQLRHRYRSLTMIVSNNREFAFALVIVVCMMIQNSNSFNPRVRCNHNQLLFNTAYSGFKGLVSSDSYLKYWSPILAADERCGQSYSTPITAVSNSSKNIQSLQMCTNFIVNLQSCCEPGSYTKWVSSLNGAYETMVMDVKYPVFKEYQRLFLQLNALNCIYPDSYNPFSVFKSADLKAAISSYLDLIQQIKQNQRKFMNETSCLVCMGTQDYPTFMLPNMTSLDNPTTNSLIFERSYFNQRVADLTALLVKLEGMHAQLLNWLKLAAAGINLSYNGASCQPLRELYMSSGFTLNEFRLCTDEKTCRQVAIKFFGLVASPQLAYFIRWRQTNTGSNTLPGSDYVIADEGGNVGFKGNSSGYANLYGTKYIPNTTFYRYSDGYANLM